MRASGLIIVLVIVITLYMTTSATRTRNSTFYVKTQEALQAKENAEANAEAAKLRELQADAERQQGVDGEEGAGGSMETEDDRQAADERSVYVGNVSKHFVQRINY